MANPAWGAKRICPSCNTRYYDMKKVPPVCPKCATAYDPEQILKSRRTRTPIDDDMNEKKMMLSTVEGELDSFGEEVLLDDVADDEDVVFMEDATELEDDEDVAPTLDRDE